MEDLKIQQWTCGDYSYESDVKMTRSGPDIRLTELEQQLEVAETRCGSLKSQLDYMKMLYQGVQPCSTELIQTPVERPQTPPKSATPSSPREIAGVESHVEEDKEHFEENTTSAPEDVKYYQFLEEIQRMQEITRELDPDLHPEKTSERQTSERSPQITPRSNERRRVAIKEEIESISADCRRTKQIRKAHVVLGSAAEPALEPLSIFTSLTAATTSLRIPEACKEQDIDDAVTFHRPMNYSLRLQDDLKTPRNLTSRFMPEDKSGCGGNAVPEHKREIRKHELVLKLSESMESAPISTIKRKRITKVEKKQRSGSCAGSIVNKTLNSKYDDALSVTSNNRSTKRKKGKLRSANSKNTVVTKDANLTDRKDSKRRKQKGHSSATHMPHRFQAPTEHVPRTKAEVVEIYHNNAVEGGSGSISISSSKHEAADQHRSSRVQKGNDELAQQHLPQVEQNRIPDQKALTEETEVRATFDQNNDEGFQKHSSRSQRTQNCTLRDSIGEEAQCSSAPQQSRYYNPTITRRYELPTVASKLKKVNRSYFNRFNFRNIPFVVSTSVTPSHNLGLNIQQVLSIMKTRQPMTTGMTPLLIRKMSKGIRPASMLTDRIADSSYSPKSPKSTILSRQDNFTPWRRPRTTTECTASADEAVKAGRSQFISITQTNSDEKPSPNGLVEEEEDRIPPEMNWVQQQEGGCVCCSKNSKSYNKILQQYTSRKSIAGNPTLTASMLLRERQEEINIGDNQYNQMENVSGKAKGIREVLINLHDQFEELNMAYEKLQEKAANSNDKSIVKQVTALEKELNAKEEEINAVVGLYKEVLHLKQQVNSIHGKNSFVCITTSRNPSNSMMVPRPRNMRAQLVINPMQLLSMRSKGISAINAREPATATRLTGLLREIQSFQKQLLAL